MELILAVVLLCAAAVEGAAQARDGGDYRLRYRDPANCSPDSCDYFIGIDTNRDNASYLDFYIVGRASGWVAVGLTGTANMFDSDVLGCITDTEDQAAPPLVMDTYNPPHPERFNALDSSEKNTNGHPSDVIVHAREYVDGHIRCVFSRLIKGADPSPQDMLLSESMFFLFGRGSNGGDSGNISAMTYHDIAIPTISKRKYNPSLDSGDMGVSTIRVKLMLVHGAAMLVAWPLLSLVAVFFAAWMKPALPNGEWFQVHRAFNLASLLVAVVGFVLVFVAQKDLSPPGLIVLGYTNKIGTAHFSLGIVIMALQFINPIISFCRCKPDDKHRWVFIVLHGIIVGYGVVALAFTNVGLGLSMYSETMTDFQDLTLLWVYLAAAIFSILLGCLLFLIFSGEALANRMDAHDVAPTVVKLFLLCCPSSYTQLRTSEAINTFSQAASSDVFTPFSTPHTPPPPPKTKTPPSRDAPLRWVALIAFLVVMVPTVVALIVLMTVRRNF